MLSAQEVPQVFFTAWVERHDALWKNSNVLSVENMLHSGLALCEEAGEVGGVIKKWHRSLERGHSAQQGKTISTEDMVGRVLEELVDLEIYKSKLLLMLGGSADLGASMYDEAWRKKFEVLHERYGTPAEDCGQCGDPQDPGS